MRPLRTRAATTPRWWTSRLAAASLLTLALPASAGLFDVFKKKDAEVVEPQPDAAPKTPKTKPIALFDTPLPIDAGPIPDGLANLTAQGCAGCHFDSHAGWSHSAHASGWRSDALADAVEVAGTPACTVCHLPLVNQRPELLTFDQGDVDKPVTGENKAFDASLRLEGVTCAACHVRGGKVVTTRPPDEVGEAPHELAWSKDLGISKGCAACHQLSWPGSNLPFYDTFGEWQESPYASAGVGCVDCHGGPGAAGRIAGLDHTMPRGTDRAVSILLDMPGLTLVRGDDPIPLGLVLQNTGAGHAFPTGSPFKGVRVRVWLEGPPDKKGNPTRTEAFTHDLARTLSDGPPWNTESDTRLPAGGQLELETELGLEFGVPDGDWNLVVELVETVRGEPTDRVVQRRELPVDVE